MAKPWDIHFLKWLTHPLLIVNFSILMVKVPHTICFLANSPSFLCFPSYLPKNWGTQAIAIAIAIWNQAIWQVLPLQKVQKISLFPCCYPMFTSGETPAIAAKPMNKTAEILSTFPWFFHSFLPNFPRCSIVFFHSFL